MDVSNGGEREPGAIATQRRRTKGRRGTGSQVLFEDSIGVGIKPRPKNKPFKFNTQLSEPYTIVGDKLWSGRPLARVEPITNKIDLISLDDDNGLDTSECKFIEPLPGNNELLASNGYSLWLVPTTSK